MDSSAFLVEDFVNAISAQLDRVQDALRLKAVNRPLTFALKDFSLDLQVFAEMDVEGNVRFRSAVPNEAGASTLRLSFTTITRPMIEENTISLAATRSPTLDELGLRPQERQRLEHLGVRNAAQLQALGRITGNNTVARYTGIPLDRIRQALALGQPNLHHIEPAPTPTPAPAPTPAQVPSRPVPQVTHSPLPPLPHRMPIEVEPVAGDRDKVFHPPVMAAPTSPRPERPAKENAPVLHVAPGVARLRLAGENLVGPSGPPTVRLNSQSLELAHADDDQVIVELPIGSRSGPLEIELPNGQQFSYHLSIQGDEGGGKDAAMLDPWAPKYSARNGSDGAQT